MTLEIGVDETFAESVADRLRSIEDRLGDAAFGRTPFVTEAASHIINAGGKRFRPLLVVLASRLYPGADDDAAERELGGRALRRLLSVRRPGQQQDRGPRQKSVPSTRHRSLQMICKCESIAYDSRDAPRGRFDEAVNAAFESQLQVTRKCISRRHTN